MYRHLGRLARTTRRLRWSQLFWRCRYAVGRRLPPPHIRLPRGVGGGHGAPAVDEQFEEPPLLHGSLPEVGAWLHGLAAGRFAHLNHVEDLGYDDPDWRLGPCGAQRLWTITLHYHAWAYELARTVRGGGTNARLAERLLVHYVSHWIDRCDLDAPGARALAWNSYTIATRITWWIRTYLALGPQWWAARAAFRDTFLQSLWRQAAFLSRHVEWDLRANHLLRDAVGLAWAGRFFRGAAPRRWLRQAEKLAASQAREQVLGDGGHFERSPMYQLHVMEDLLSLARLCRDGDTCERLWQAWRSMAEFLAWARHPDGDIPLLNDAAGGSEPTPDALLAFAAAREPQFDACPRRGGRHFADTGLAVWHGTPWSLFFDVGPVGPDCQPGHAHADTLTIECSFRGRRLFVDPGTFAYDHDERRRYDRSTAAHNTVTVDGRDSSEVWHIFRVGARAAPRDVRMEITPREITAIAAHDGYAGLPGAPRHCREVAVAKDGPLRIVDRVEGGGEHTLEGGYLLDPAWSVEARADGWLLTQGERRVRVALSGGDGLERRTLMRPVHPQFGLEMQTTRLAWHARTALPFEVTTVVEEA